MKMKHCSSLQVKNQIRGKKMKTKKNENKFGFKKITIANLDNREMIVIRGGGSDGGDSCPSVTKYNCPFTDKP